MMRTTGLPKYDVVLLGIGHTNAHVLKMWRMHAPPDCRLTCISNFPVVTYSGMLPGVLSGQYPRERMEIDLVRLCAAAGVRLIVGQATGIDRSARKILFPDRMEIPYDWLSIGIGSVPGWRSVEVSSPQRPTIVLIKPMQTFLARLHERLERVKCQGANPVRVVVVGAGAGGFEISMCLHQRLRTALGEIPFELSVVHGSDGLIGGVSGRTSAAAQRELEARGIRLLLGRRVTAVCDSQLELDDGTTLLADVALWATSAVAPPLLSTIGLPTDQRGFLLTRPTLQSVADDRIFVVGDSGTATDDPTPKAGVYAVRQGPVLWDNLQRSWRGEPLRAYRPQRGFLKLFNLGDGRALGEYLGWTFSGRWAWTWKNSIDSRFMDMYQDYRPAAMAVAQSGVDSGGTPPRIRCAGCGGKVGGAVLSRVLRRLELPRNEHVVLGLESPDDAAIIRLPPEHAVNATVDFFAAPLDDPYTVGRIAALNSASDCFATGARPIAALAAVTIPVGPPAQQEQLLLELLGGAVREFRVMGTALVGGHTIEGPQLTIGFTVLGEQLEPRRTKDRLRPGDQLILTKPLGTGILLAALMQADCRATWFEPLLQSMLLSNQPAAELCERYDVLGVTDVTGFGLAGHLLEMLRSSGVAADLHLNQVPLLPGVVELSQAGLESTLAPDNRGAETEMETEERLRRQPAYAALFDPQTGGGLLLGVPERHVSAVMNELARQSAVPAAWIGQVRDLAGESSRLRCRE